MMIDKLLNTSYYPIMDIRNKKIYIATSSKLNSICTICENKECINIKKISDYELKKCYNDLLYFRIQIQKNTYIVFGLFNDYKNLHRKDKKKFSQQIYFKDLEYVKSWLEQINNIISDYNAEISSKQLSLESQNSVFIHDMKKIYSTILRNLENYIIETCENPGNLDNCIKNLDGNLLGVYKSINLLDYQFSIIDYTANPESISYGKTMNIKIYKAVDKLVRIFQTISKNKIRLVGSSHNELNTYQSFMTLIFILIDNAIKYSYDEQEIIVKINDNGYGKVFISVSSFSPYLDSKDKKKIFEKYYRGETAKSITSDGKGIGLYLANKISKVLDTQISINCSKITKINDIPYSNVEFSIELGNIEY